MRSVDGLEFFFGSFSEFGVALETIGVPDLDQHAVGFLDLPGRCAGVKVENVQRLAPRAERAFLIDRISAQARVHGEGETRLDSIAASISKSVMRRHEVMLRSWDCTVPLTIPTDGEPFRQCFGA